RTGRYSARADRGRDSPAARGAGRRRPPRPAPAESRERTRRNAGAVPPGPLPRGNQARMSPCGLLPDILEVLAGLEADGPAGRNADFLTSPRVAADAPLPGLHLEDAEPAQLDAVAALHGEPHGIEY